MFFCHFFFLPVFFFSIISNSAAVRVQHWRRVNFCVCTAEIKILIQRNVFRSIALRIIELELNVKYNKQIIICVVCYFDVLYMNFGWRFVWYTPTTFGGNTSIYTCFFLRCILIFSSFFLELFCSIHKLNENCLVCTIHI